MRVKKFYSYIEDISKIHKITKQQVIKNNLKIFDFNLKSGAHGMHALHYAV
jgi:hypothetical protein